jgi:hypothetical protein
MKASPALLPSPDDLDRLPPPLLPALLARATEVDRDRVLLVFFAPAPDFGVAFLAIRIFSCLADLDA